MPQPTILIVGATGQLGTRLVRQLAATGIKPRALVRNREKGESIASMATPVLGDLLEPRSLVDAFGGADHVFIVAPPAPQMEALERNAIDAAIAAGAKRVVYLSNFAATEGSTLRPMHIHGLHERVIASLDIEDGLLLETGGSGIMTCIDPDDVAAVAVKALTEDAHAGQTYRLTSEDTFTAAGLAALLSKFLGRQIKVAQNADGPASTAGYFDLVAAGVYRKTDTAAKLLGRPPRAYADWLKDFHPSL
jgi:uncharacterized protein YbjT (DUF2867 family)